MSHPFDALDGENFMNLTTYRKSGKAVPTPVWFAREGDALYIFTDPQSGKVKRLRHTAEVELAPCKANGEITGETFSAQCHIIQDDAEAKHANQALTRKYGIQKRLFEIWFRFRGRKNPTFLKVTA